MTLSNWDTSNVTDMSLMFRSTSTFNQDISDWNTSKVINMYGMFENASKFNQDISNWNTSSVNNYGQICSVVQVLSIKISAIGIPVV